MRRVALVLDPAEVARSFRAEIRAEVAALGQPLVLAGFLTTDHGPSKTYAEYTKKGCDDVGVAFDLFDHLGQAIATIASPCAPSRAAAWNAR